MLKQHLGEQTTSNMFQHLGLQKTTCETTFRPAAHVTARANADGMYTASHVATRVPRTPRSQKRVRYTVKIVSESNRARLLKTYIQPTSPLLPQTIVQPQACRDYWSSTSKCESWGKTVSTFDMWTTFRPDFRDQHFNMWTTFRRQIANIQHQHFGRSKTTSCGRPQAKGTPPVDSSAK